MIVQKSALFMRQWREYAQVYKDRAGLAVAEKFIAAVEEAAQVIGRNPHIGAPYDPGEGFEDLQNYGFRKWSLRGFPHMVLFRLKDNTTLIIEALYAHKMDIASRLTSDIDTPFH